MKCNAAILASFVLGQSVMASKVHQPGGRFHLRPYNGTEPSYSTGTGASSGFPFPTGSGKPHHTSKPRKTKTKSSAAATSAAAISSEASVVTSATDTSTDVAAPSTVLYTTTLTNHLSETVVVTVTPQPATSIPEASASASAPAVVDPSTLKSEDVQPSSKAPANTLPPYPTTFATATSTVASTGFASGTGGAAYPTGTLIAAYYQCGGIDYTGSTTCVEGCHCKVQNPFYSQCIYDARSK